MQYLSCSPHRRIRGEYSRTSHIGSSSSQIFKRSTNNASSCSFKRYRTILHRELRTIPTINLDFSGDSQMMSRNEKKLLQEVNGRFARFIEKVHLLENRNKSLEREIGDIMQSRKCSSLDQQYDPILKDLRKQVHDIAQQNRQIQSELDHLEQDLYSLRAKCEQEARYRTNIESGIMTMRTHLNDAHLSKTELCKKAKALDEEIHFLKQKHKEEVSKMMAQIHEAQLSAETKGSETEDITASLRDIRRQLEGRASSGIRHIEQYFQAQTANIMEASERNRKTLEAMKQDIAGNKKLLQTKIIGLENLKGVKEALEKQLNTLEEDHDKEVNQYQDAVRWLKLELENSMSEMSAYCQQYQDLLNVKMALDVEIASYRQLLEGEEMRLHSCTQGPAPYVYRQSPVYTLPYFTIQRGQCYKVMPQYKFVEEIITETTREVELSETEETESERSSSEGACGEKEKGGTNGEGEVSKVEMTPEEEDAAGSEEEGRVPAGKATGSAAAVEEGEDGGEEAVMRTHSLSNAEENTQDKRPTAILKDKSTETEDMTGRMEESHYAVVQEAPECRSVAMSKAEQLTAEHEVEEKSIRSQIRASSGLREMDLKGQSHSGGPTQDKPQEGKGSEKDEMLFTGGKGLLEVLKTLEKEAYGLVKVKESLLPEVKILGRSGEETRASDIEVKPEESPEKGTVGPVKSLDQSCSKLACSAKCEPDTPLIAAAAPKGIPEKSLESLSKSGTSTPATSQKAMPGLEMDSEIQEPTILLKADSSSEMKIKNINSAAMDSQGGGKLRVTVIYDDIKL